MSLLEFLDKIIDKYTGEAILSFVLLKVATSSIAIKGYVFMIYVCSLLRLRRAGEWLTHDIIIHPIYLKIHQLSLKEYLKYINNKDYRTYMDYIITTIVVELSNILYQDLDTSPRNMLIMSRKQFSIFLERRVLELRLSHMENVRALVTEGMINDVFSRKYLTWIELVYETTSKRVKDLSLHSNNYLIYKGFLWIMQDLVMLYVDLVPSVINTINGEVKKDITTMNQQKEKQ